MARQFNLIPPVCEQAEYHFFQREKVETQLPELYHKIGKSVVGSCEVKHNLNRLKAVIDFEPCCSVVVSLSQVWVLSLGPLWPVESSLESTRTVSQNPPEPQ